MNKERILMVLLLVIGLIGGYSYGYSTGRGVGDGEGYKRAEADIKKLEQVAGDKATGEAAKAANPFQTVNPLAGVESNPFEKAKKVLNPFQ